MSSARHLCIASFVAALSMATHATAQGLSFDDIDTNRNGTLDGAEIAFAFGPSAQAALLKFDANGDGTVTLAEVREGNNASNGAERGQSASAPGQTGDTPGRSGDDNPGRSGDDNPGRGRD